MVLLVVVCADTSLSLGLCGNCSGHSSVTWRREELAVLWRHVDVDAGGGGGVSTHLAVVRRRDAVVRVTVETVADIPVRRGEGLVVPWGHVDGGGSGCVWRRVTVVRGVWRHVTVVRGVWRRVTVVRGVWRRVTVVRGVWRRVTVVRGVWRRVAVLSGVCGDTLLSLGVYGDMFLLLGVL